VSEIEDRLKQYDDDFAGASVRHSFNELPPDGLYQALVDDFDWLDFNNGLNLKTVLKLTTNDSWDGHPVETIHALEVPDRLNWVKQHLTTLGLDVDDPEFRLSRLDNYLPQLLNVPVELEVKTSDRINEKTGEPYRNAYVQTRLGDPLPGGTVPLSERGELPVDTEGLSAEDARAAVEEHKSGHPPIPKQPVPDDADIPFD
jgi:hypothetical protein